MSRVIIQPKFTGEIRNQTFDFISSLATAETISTQVVTCTVYSGVDPSPSSVIMGAATASGTIVTQKIGGGVAGVVYELRCTVTTSVGQTLQLTGYLAIVPELP